MTYTMKKTFLSILLVTTSTLLMPCNVSCTKNGQEQEEKEDQKPVDPAPTGPQPGTYTFTASPLKGKWEAGDKIYVHGSYGPAAQMITLTASDISSDGRTATAKLDAVTEYPCQPDGLYAAWPGEAVIGQEGLMEASTGFNRMDMLLSLAYLTDNRFDFVDAASGLSFSVSGFTQFVLAGNQRPGLRFTEYEPEYSSLNESFYNRRNDGYPFLEGTIQDGTALLWFPGPLSLKDGLTLYFGNDGTWPYTFTLADDILLSAGKITDLGDITSSLTPYDGPEPKMPEMGKMTSYSVEISDLSGLCHSLDHSFLWAVGNNGTLGKISYGGTISEVHSIGGDAEGITLDPETGNLLIANEPNGVAIIEAPNYAGKSKTLFKLKEASKYSNSGMEGITYYKDGLIYCGTQTSSNLFLCDLKAETDSEKYTKIVWVKSLSSKFPAIREIGGLYYDSLTDWLWITDSESRKIFALTGDAEHLLGSYDVRAIGNAESICVDHKNSCIWIGHDPDSSPSKIFRFDFTGLDDAIIPSGN